MTGELIVAIFIGLVVNYLLGYLVGKMVTLRKLIDELNDADYKLPKRYSFVIECIKEKFEKENQWFI